MRSTFQIHLKDKTRLNIEAFPNFKVIRVGEHSNELTVFFENDEQIRRLALALFELRFQKQPDTVDDSEVIVID